MTMTSSSMSLWVDETVGVVAYEEMYDQPLYMPLIYDFKMSEKRQEIMASTSGLGAWAVKNETQDPSSDKFTQQFKKSFVHKTKSVYVPISRELVEDQDWSMLEEVGIALGESAVLTMETDAAAPFNDAFNGSEYKTEGDLSICNNAHVNVDGGNSQDNNDTQTLGMAGLNTSRVALEKQTNYRGNVLNINTDILIVPKDLQETGWEIVRSTGRPDTANRSENFNYGSIDLVVWRLLTDTNAWFIGNKRLIRRNWKWFQRVAPEIYGDGPLLSGTRRMIGYMRYSLGVRSFLGIYGNNPS